MISERIAGFRRRILTGLVLLLLAGLLVGCAQSEEACPAPSSPLPGRLHSVEIAGSDTDWPPYYSRYTAAGEVREVDSFGTQDVRLHLQSLDELARWGGNPAPTSDTFSVLLQQEDEAGEDWSPLPAPRVGDRVVVVLSRGEWGGSSAGFLIADSLGMRYAYDDGGNILAGSSLMPASVSVVPSVCRGDSWEFPYLRFERDPIEADLLEGERDTLRAPAGWGGPYIVVEALMARRLRDEVGCYDCQNAYYGYVIRRIE